MLNIIAVESSSKSKKKHLCFTKVECMEEYFSLVKEKEKQFTANFASCKSLLPYKSNDISWVYILSPFFANIVTIDELKDWKKEPNTNSLAKLWTLNSCFITYRKTWITCAQDSPVNWTWLVELNHL